ncbi:PDZ domain-containing protein [Streptomyces sp. OF3]|uniref:endopeptidase La n=1 Tax=Streptomyces alkaliterrae TaxID=2213162 RepID=A0A7W3WHL9_9ACTN|nr:S16 family serine protease [Streptomyces alkaliterrae]MBB1252487.1 PDZ domain-containing protein [Streptomyces alkaliterrae]
MSRRHATIFSSLLLLIGLVCTLLVVRVPYSELSPGPTVNTLGKHGGDPVLSIDGRRTYPTSGHLNMTTVRVTSADYQMSLPEALYGWFRDDSSVVPHETLYPDGKTAEEAEQENAEEFTQSQESAKAAALKELGIEVPTRTVVAAVVKDGPAEGTLRAGDIVKAVDGEPVKQPADVAKLVTEHKPGEEVVFTVVPVKQAEAAEKAGQDPTASPTKEVTVRTVAAEEDNRAIVGIQAGSAHTFPFRIDIKLADVGGPSAGLMFSLAIVDKLSRPDLTGGAFVAGTGTINADGEVGPIGGVQMKTVAARRAGATHFLTPEANCPSALGNAPDGLTLVKVGSLDDALKALEALREDRPADIPRCTAD